MYFFVYVVYSLSTIQLVLSIFTNRDDIQDQELKEIREMLHKQAEMLHNYGETINILENENIRLTKEAEELYLSNQDLRSRIEILEERHISDLNPSGDVSISGVSKNTSFSLATNEEIFIRRKNANAVEPERIRRAATNTDNAVGFYAMMTQNSRILVQGQPAIFNNVVTNLGNAYDHTHGVFTAPVSGLYSFSSTVVNGGSSVGYMDMELVKNGVIAGHLYATHAGSRGKATVVLSLDLADRVWVRGNSHVQDLHQIVEGSRYSCFSGFLIASTS